MEISDYISLGPEKKWLFTIRCVREFNQLVNTENKYQSMDLFRCIGLKMYNHISSVDS